ncbi:SubName: Full=Uncharacterized protein {ECO:0000313/EMBL:CCA71762.1} [Serendipita indica DSM 11827]|uniref:Uncharacterized protein n=1 Tax=Serendipita indica (strain DSM 11827) TaxID=1109443 RepID=G4TKB9_SERID|nr:SubName: Full=Uncharacterized protein {ECO:0000313/EMBL:CCA71762.1} [Serendipita indica DSM 11827]CCA71762.1 hypothetical protein PIIN_05697 [Serendipita indica DSM 11827]
MMIGASDGSSKLDNPYDYGSVQATTSSVLRTEELPPPFESNPRQRPVVIDLLQDEDNWVQSGGEQPPEFTPYEAQHWVNSDGNVISHDPHLNEDGEALYRFLLSQTTEPPRFAVRCRGTHRETRTRVVTHTGHGHSDNGGHHHSGSHTKVETYTETVVDFDFRIDLTQHLHPPVNWTASDEEPTYRGKMVWEKDVQDGIALQRQRTTRAENKAAGKWRKFRDQAGLPPWIRSPSMPGEERPRQAHAANAVAQSSRTVRNWADDYCASDKLLKEFVFEKVVHGWNLGALEKAIETLIRSTYYTGDLHISFPMSANKVYIRPTNQLSRALSHWWVKLLLWITLIYPFIWLFKRFSKRGGGIWQVAGAAYSLKEWVHLEDSVAGEDVARYLIRKEEARAQLPNRSLTALPAYSSDLKSPLPITSSTGDAWTEQRPTTLAQFGLSSQPQASSSSAAPLPTISKLRQTPKGVSELVGLREGEWFKQWEGTITRSVLLRVDRSDPLALPGEILAESAGAMLDGYND